jgi:hypothetical protein
MALELVLYRFQIVTTHVVLHSVMIRLAIHMGPRIAMVISSIGRSHLLIRFVLFAGDNDHW